ncbi:MAG: glycosyltransferase family 39 protein [Clostridiales Family XIII bacterium]|jgi:integral membrane protein (TIGR03766 family)|nr:glycosyltransferase family 39 protein [Clostridiales Family XIII bacterium]
MYDKSKNLTRNVFSVCVALALPGVFRSPNFDPTKTTDRFAAIAIIITILVLALLFSKRGRALAAGLCARLARFAARHAFAVSAAAFGLALLFQALLIVNLNRDTDWDVLTIFDTATGQGDAVTATWYFSLYGALRPFFFAMHAYSSMISGLFGSSRETMYLAWYSLNAACIDFSVIVAALAAKAFFGRAAAYLSYYSGLLLIVFTTHMMTPYTDTFVMPFVALFLLFFSKLWRKESLAEGCARRPALWAFLLGASAAGIYLIKFSALVFLIAIVILGAFLLFKNRSRETLRKTVVLAAVFAAGVFVCLGAYKAYEQNQDILVFDNDTQIPLTHHIMMGMHGTGGFNYDDVLATLSFPTAEEQKAFHYGEIKRTLKEYGLQGAIRFYAQKYELNISDGTMLHWMGYDWQPEMPEGRLKDFLKSAFYPDFPRFGNYRFYSQAVWAATLLLAAAAYRKKGFAATMLRLTLLGALLYLLIFEGGRTRYMIQYLPCFMMLAALGLQSVGGFLGNIARRSRADAGRP